MSNSEESSPLLSNQPQPTTTDETTNKSPTKTPPTPDTKTKQSPPPIAPVYGWTADGLPLTHAGANVIGEPLPRAQWDSGLFACLGHNDDFCSSDLEVCLLGSVAPCVVYGSNVERLGSAPGTFANHCLPYTGLYLIGNSLFGWNCMAPWFSYPTRTAIRRKFNLQGNWEGMSKSCGGCCDMEEEQLEQAELACDFATHVCCHPCALCQEGREIRRRVPHPGFGAQAMAVMIAPGGQTMGRH
ncbi:putative PLAC8 motif-containing protein [Helianthus annuus]|uniref:PLAC8 motif-containing protein n=1 Tax=Helianthus annuus TaxID=4232 RepID=A0A251SRI9_HELAN|nr:cell number regulator 8 [Helianthus annuus]KAF5773059.1 putative PLAC8 motif-containing protein [Helianthus annuus]KAJ0476601.1 putative PLAC8 motif-containing protein [Helianthus annuus]KAJ0497420.1 putative PLAC8 motif-containing protein [Helianthus annuus]KAJ0663438.1 putative PLAC8 motif-containing protein [Helianthus annuus]KAJ0848883.1 putative PLAC8 motif-containing protein [Helianthus annuus]